MSSDTGEPLEMKRFLPVLGVVLAVLGLIIIERTVKVMKFIIDRCDGILL